ncbi:type IV pilus modification protein PilV [Shewanella sairae]|uniref:Type IV pilus modification protein PilV n=1 Tax=Shewanella sairae TaxID=190310 RepID=A0ABQ4PE62_9GAMM|nr:type IV pilus modification protein PilV [Shewanella sairae]MCL1128654.1 type IV pilus modification protein PilV [Shewanella sairae]GIU45837.1 type IV pilus modification protein PilV [Shewanella sairae]
MRSRENGFSLIEVLVALVILVVGLIGVFNLHLVAKRGSFESFQQSQASYFAQDIINRMKLNRTQLIAYTGNYNGSLAHPNTACEVTVGASVVCSVSQTLAWDLYKWEQQMLGFSEVNADSLNVGGLDSPSACVSALANGDVTVVITWRGIRELSDGASNNLDSFVRNCGTASDRRRVYSVKTVII